MKVINSSSYINEKVVPCRPLDYIYDPLYTFSGSKDFYKAANEAHKSSSEYSVQPIFDSMFSDMVRYPSANLVLRSSHHPRTIDTSYKGKVRATLQQKTEKPEVTGTDRYKYFRRPVTESQSGSPSTSRFPLLGGERVTNLGILAPPTTAQMMPTHSPRLSTAAQSRAVQTDYRESETQTQPWAPPFITRSDTPEVLYLERLTWGDGLPPGKHEVDVVERLRKKRAWEAQLPLPDSDANIKTRYKLIAEMEKSDWEFREQEVEAVHNERIKKSGQILEQHVLLNRAKLSSRMEFLQDDINKRKEKKLQMFHHKKERALRKICMKEKSFKHQKKNVIDELLQHTSELYAPKKRMGYSFRNRDFVLSEKSISIDRRDTFPETLMKYRPTFDFERLAKPKNKMELCYRETRWNMGTLVKLHQDLHDLRKKEKENKIQADPFGQAIQLSLIPTPSVNEMPTVPQTLESTEKLYQAATLIQRVIQGRAMQSMMHLERERWRDTMEELKVTESMSETERAVFQNQKSQDIQSSRLEAVVENIVGLNVGFTISQTLELLAKELLRIKNEAVGHSLALQAESDRWKREAAEGGRRQKEMRRREEHGLMFSQLMQVYQDSINEFMEALVIRARENEAKTQALKYAEEMAILAELEDAKRRAKELEPVSADLLFEFIAPEGLRALTRACMLILRQKYLEARQHLVEKSRAEPDSMVSERKSTTSKIYSEQESKLAIIPEQEQITEEESYFSTRTHSYSQESSKTSVKSENAVIQQRDTKVVQYEVSDSVSPQLESYGRSSVPTFGFVSPEDSTTLEERLLEKVMHDMCYVAGALFHTAAKILNKALHLAGIPRESFEEALMRTMQVINEAREEVVLLIAPQPQIPQTHKTPLLPSQLASREIIVKATEIVDDILRTAVERIRERRTYSESSETIIDASETDAQVQVKSVIEDLLKEAEHRVFQAIVEDFLSDLLAEAQEKAALIKKDLETT